MSPTSYQLLHPAMPKSILHHIAISVKRGALPSFILPRAPTAAAAALIVDFTAQIHLPFFTFFDKFAQLVLEGLLRIDIFSLARRMDNPTLPSEIEITLTLTS